MLLIEAGPLFPSHSAIPTELMTANSLAASVPGHPLAWTFRGQLTAERSVPVIRGRVVGGSGAINGTYFVRGAPEDFSRWVELGNDAWSFAHVLPYFKRLEHDLDFDDEFHGQGGPIPVRRESESELSPASQCFIEACLEAGFGEDPDKNAPGPGGVGRVPLNSVGNVRMSPALTHLLPSLGRHNLTVLPDAMVHRVVFDGRRAVGVSIEHAGSQRTYRAGEVVLAAGAVKSPQLLMVSGIGPPDALRTLGIPVVHDSLGVGVGFSDHPDVHVTYSARSSALPAAALFQVAVNYSARGSNIAGDMEIAASSRSLASAVTGASGVPLARGLLTAATNPSRAVRTLRELTPGKLMEQIRRRGDLVLSCSLQQERSRGRLCISSADPRVAPTLIYNYLDEESDRVRLRECVRLAARLVESQPFRVIGGRLTAPDPSTLMSDRSLDRWIRASVVTAIHTSGTCRMGPNEDATAVVDQRLRVRGVDGLRVVDGSVMPSIVSRGPHATVVMIGERAAEFFD